MDGVRPSMLTITVNSGFPPPQRDLPPTSVHTRHRSRTHRRCYCKRSCVHFSVVGLCHPNQDLTAITVDTMNWSQTVNRSDPRDGQQNISTSVMEAEAKAAADAARTRVTWTPEVRAYRRLFCYSATIAVLKSCYDMVTHEVKHTIE